MFKALLDGKFEYALVGGVLLTSRILIRQTDAAALLAMTNGNQSFVGFPEPAEYTQMDACNVLNLHTRSRDAVLGIRHSVRAGNIRIPVDAVHAIGQARASLAELSARTGVHWKTLSPILGPQDDVFGWEREKACGKLDLPLFA